MMATAGLGPRAGYLPNMLDVAPNYAGVVMGTADAVATVLIIIMHAIVMRTTNDSTDIGETILSTLASAFLVVGAIVFHYGCSDEEIVKGSGMDEPHLLLVRSNGELIANPAAYSESVEA
mmetsp:Transcript_23119/g.47928  ORF Transcript_23119/g.47928 Transcript_23119/m.47928 type:complete len:120 (-) Transcript_23119:168-527(-)